MIGRFEKAKMLYFFQKDNRRVLTEATDNDAARFQIGRYFDQHVQTPDDAHFDVMYALDELPRMGEVIELTRHYEA